MFYIYILRCEDNSLYTGITTCVKRRFPEHMEGKGAKYTKAHKPTKIEAMWMAETKSDASKLEYRIKELTKTEKEELIASDEKILRLIWGGEEITVFRCKEWI